MRKLKLFIAALALTLGVGTASAQASYNTSWTEGVEVTTGYDYFLYNIGSGTFLTGGMDWGSRASGDHAGKTVEFRSAGEGVYKIWSYYYSSNGLENDGWLGINAYLDAGDSKIANCVFTKVDVSGFTNAYTIKNTTPDDGEDNNNNKFLRYNPDDTRGQWVDNANDKYAYWLIIPKANRDAIGDYTYYIQNVGMNRFWERACWAGSTWGNTGFSTGGRAANPCSEKYHGAFDFKQTLSRDGLSAGRYRLYAQAFWRQDGSAAGPVLYINDQTQALLEFNANGEGTDDNMNGASDAFTAGQYVNSVEKFFSSAPAGDAITLGINITDGNQWVCWDNFYFQYLGQVVLDYAVELPTSGAMEANKWYYFDIAAAADNYKATSTNLGDIICVNDQYTLTSATTGTVTLKEKDNSFTPGRYFVKSTSANNLVVEAESYLYNVGDATLSLSDGNYTQTNTFTATFENESTNDPSASFAILDADKIKVNNVKATASLSGKVLTITLAEPLTPSTVFAINIDAGAIGFDAANANTAISLTVKTPAVFDGHYYIKKDGADLFFSRGGDDNKQVVLDQFGVPVKITTDDSNMTRVKFIDTGLLLGASGSSNMYWTDKGDGTPSTVNWTIAKSGDKYKFYLLSMDDAKKGMNIHTNGTEPKSDTEANACEWELELPAAHPAKLQAVKDAQAAGVATAAGITGVSTQAEMAAKLAADYGETDIAITGTGGTNKEAWQKSASTGTGSEYDVFAEETVTGLAPGLYRLRVYAFERIAGGQAVYDAGGAAGLAYVYANDQKVKLASLFDVAADSPWKSGNDLTFGGKYYANGQEGAQAAFNAGKYANDVYVLVVDEGSGTGSIKFGIKQPNCYYSGSNAHNNAQWICFNNFSLTYYEAKPTDAQKQALANAITTAEANTLGFEKDEYAPYNNITALEALTAAKAVDVNTASAATVVDATTALTSATWTANTDEVNAFGDPTFAKSSNDGAQLGWITDHSAGLGGSYHARAFVLESGAGNYNNLGAFGQGDGTRSAGYFRFDGTNSAKTTTYTYGETDGYTVPLKAKSYNLTAQIGGWGQVDKDVIVQVVNENNEVVGSQTVHTPNPGVNAGGNVVDVNFFFQLSAPGNYKVQLKNGSDADNAIVISNLNLCQGVAYTVAGSQSLFGTDWDVADANNNMTLNADGTYSITYTNVALTANVEYKVVKNHDWNNGANAWPANNRVIGINMPGNYDVTINFNPATNEVYETMALYKNITAAKYATLYAPYDLNFEGTGVTAYTATVNNSEVTFNEVTAAKANTGLLLKADEGTCKLPMEACATDTPSDLKGVTTDTPVAAGIFVLKNGGKGVGFYKTTQEFTVGAYTAYLEALPNSSRDFIGFGDDTTTGIEALSTKTMDGEVYNLQGQRVNKAHKGLYIVNGKKVVLK